MGFSDTEFMSAAEKMKVLKNWRAFVASGYKRAKFTKALYQHLHLHCGFIAHFNIDGFYRVRFVDPKGRWSTLVAIYGAGKGYKGRSDYADINQALALAFNMVDEIEQCREELKRDATEIFKVAARTLVREYHVRPDELSSILQTI